jgi:hypothetical protein
MKVLYLGSELDISKDHRFYEDGFGFVVFVQYSQLYIDYHKKVTNSIFQKVAAIFNNCRTIRFQQTIIIPSGHHGELAIEHKDGNKHFYIDDSVKNVIIQKATIDGDIIIESKEATAFALDFLKLRFPFSKITSEGSIIEIDFSPCDLPEAPEQAYNSFLSWSTNLVLKEFLIQAHDAQCQSTAQKKSGWMVRITEYNIAKLLWDNNLSAYSINNAGTKSCVVGKVLAFYSNSSVPNDPVHSDILYFAAYRRPSDNKLMVYFDKKTFGGGSYFAILNGIEYELTKIKSLLNPK